MTFLPLQIFMWNAHSVAWITQIPRRTRQGSGQTVEWTPIQILIMPFNFISMCILASPGLTELCKAMRFGGSCSRCTDSHAFWGRFSKALPAAWPRLKAIVLEPAPTTILQSASFPHTCSWRGVGVRDWKEGKQEMKESEQMPLPVQLPLKPCQGLHGGGTCPALGEGALKWTWPRK